jgi:hypothetical protein
MPCCSKICDKKEIIDEENRIVYGTTKNINIKVYSDLMDLLDNVEYMELESMISYEKAIISKDEDGITYKEKLVLKKGWTYKKVGE